MIRHANLRSRKKLYALIKKGVISLGAHKKAKIYGTLHCASGKRMRRENRVFFTGEQEAVREGYRPCGHCLPEAYKKWKMEVEWK